MARADFVYDCLWKEYADNEPIFLSDIRIPGMKDVAIRQQLKKLTTDGRLKRFDTGIYFIPGKSMFRSGSMLSFDDVIKKKYLMDGTKQCGYVSGLLFANHKATTEYRETQLANLRVILRKPRVKIDETNAATLQFLDLLKEVVDIAEIDGGELTSHLLDYMKKKKIGFESMKQYLPYYPERIYKNMFEVGLLNGVSA